MELPGNNHISSSIYLPFSFWLFFMVCTNTQSSLPSNQLAGLEPKRAGLNNVNIRRNLQRQKGWEGAAQELQHLPTSLVKNKAACLHGTLGLLRRLHCARPQAERDLLPDQQLPLFIRAVFPQPVNWKWQENNQQLSENISHQKQSFSTALKKKKAIKLA